MGNSKINLKILAFENLKWLLLILQGRVSGFEDHSIYILAP
jgi:hypothetical protein